MKDIKLDNGVSLDEVMDKARAANEKLLSDDWYDYSCAVCMTSGPDDEGEPDAEFIARMDPHTALAMGRMIRAQDARVRELEGSVSESIRLHTSDDPDDFDYAMTILCKLIGRVPLNNPAKSCTVADLLALNEASDD